MSHSWEASGDDHCPATCSCENLKLSYRAQKGFQESLSQTWSWTKSWNSNSVTNVVNSRIFVKPCSWRGLNWGLQESLTSLCVCVGTGFYTFTAVKVLSVPPSSSWKFCQHPRTIEQHWKVRWTHSSFCFALFVSLKFPSGRCLDEVPASLPVSLAALANCPHAWASSSFR